MYMCTYIPINYRRPNKTSSVHDTIQIMTTYPYNGHTRIKLVSVSCEYIYRHKLNRQTYIETFFQTEYLDLLWDNQTCCQYLTIEVKYLFIEGDHTYIE